MIEDVEERLKTAHRLIQHEGNCNFTDIKCGLSCPCFLHKGSCGNSDNLEDRIKRIKICGRYIAKHSSEQGEWDNFTKKQLWEELQKLHTEKTESTIKTTREEIAALAMQGILSNSEIEKSSGIFLYSQKDEENLSNSEIEKKWINGIASAAINCADALIRKLEEK